MEHNKSISCLPNTNLNLIFNGYKLTHLKLYPVFRAKSRQSHCKVNQVSWLSLVLLPPLSDCLFSTGPLLHLILLFSVQGYGLGLQIFTPYTPYFNYHLCAAESKCTQLVLNRTIFPCLLRLPFLDIPWPPTPHVQIKCMIFFTSYAPQTTFPF